ncbi:mucin-5AC-like [Pollicipes pollicipes]|uniref:mucin-5AC-like n=1 Tax=Pollicipes pollicipes TaxID=41117 RepID=UPI00188588EA|nr:mucin-5AC-like [Pollicipes pollicipes]
MATGARAPAGPSPLMAPLLLLLLLLLAPRAASESDPLAVDRQEFQTQQEEHRSHMKFERGSGVRSTTSAPEARSGGGGGEPAAPVPSDNYATASRGRVERLPAPTALRQFRGSPRLSTKPPFVASRRTSASSAADEFQPVTGAPIETYKSRVNAINGLWAQERATAQPSPSVSPVLTHLAESGRGTARPTAAPPRPSAGGATRAGVPAEPTPAAAAALTPADERHYDAAGGRDRLVSTTRRPDTRRRQRNRKRRPHKTPSGGYLKISSGVPSKTYGTPTKAYGTPTKAYGTPTKSYGAPSQSYDAPSHAYDAPSQASDEPSQTYDAPSPSYNRPAAHPNAIPAVHKPLAAPATTPAPVTYPSPTFKPQLIPTFSPQTSPAGPAYSTAAPTAGQTYGTPTTQNTAPQAGQTYVAPQAGQTYAAPQAGQTYAAPQAGQTYAAPQAGQTYAAPQAGQTYTAPQAGQTYAAPQAGQTYAAPQAGQTYAAPQAGQTYAAPQAGQTHIAPQAGQTYAAPQTGQTYAAPQAGQTYAAPQPAKTYVAPQVVNTYSPQQTGNKNSAPQTGQTYIAPVAVQQSYSTPVPAQQSYSAPAQQSYSTPPPAQQSYSAPAQQSYSTPAPAQQSYSAPAQQSYSTPAPAQQSYSAPVQQPYSTPAPAQQSYASPAPAQQSYASPAPAQQSYASPVPAQQTYASLAPAGQSYLSVTRTISPAAHGGGPDVTISHHTLLPSGGGHAPPAPATQASQLQTVVTSPEGPQTTANIGLWTLETTVDSPHHADGTTAPPAADEPHHHPHHPVGGDGREPHHPHHPAADEPHHHPHHPVGNDRHEHGSHGDAEEHFVVENEIADYQPSFEETDTHSRPFLHTLRPQVLPPPARSFVPLEAPTEPSLRDAVPTTTVAAGEEAAEISTETALTTPPVTRGAVSETTAVSGTTPRALHLSLTPGGHIPRLPQPLAQTQVPHGFRQYFASGLSAGRSRAKTYYVNRKPTGAEETADSVEGATAVPALGVETFTVSGALSVEDTAGRESGEDEITGTGDVNTQSPFVTADFSTAPEIPEQEVFAEVTTTRPTTQPVTHKPEETTTEHRLPIPTGPTTVNEYVATLQPYRITTDQPRKHTITTDQPRKLSITTDQLRKHTITTDLPRKHTITTDQPRKHTITTDQPRKHTITTDQPQKLSITADPLRKHTITTDQPRKHTTQLESRFAPAARTKPTSAPHPKRTKKPLLSRRRPVIPAR